MSRKIKNIAYIDQDDGYYGIYVNGTLVFSRDCPIDNLLTIFSDFLDIEVSRLSQEEISPEYALGEPLPAKFKDLELYKGEDWYKDLRYLEL